MSGAAAKTPKGVVPPSGGGRSSFLSDVIVELGFASRETVEEAVRAAGSPGTTVAGQLVDMGAITEAQLARATAERHRVDYVDLSVLHVDADVANLIKPAAARRYQAVPVARLGDSVLVAMADPADTLGVSDIASMTKLEVRPAVTSRPALEALLEALPLDESGWQAPREAGAEAEEPEVLSEDFEAPKEPLAEPLPTPDVGDASQLRDELEALKRQLAGAEAKLKGDRPPPDSGESVHLRARLAAAEAELEAARDRLREAKEVGAELESVREKLQAAEAGLDQASARARESEVAAAETAELRAELSRLKHERDELRSELRRVGADAELRTGDLETLRTKLTNAETELVRARAEADALGSELEAMRTRTAGAEREAQDALHRASEAEQQADEARRRAAEVEREASTAQRLAEELAAAEERTGQARQALAELRQESERELAAADGRAEQARQALTQLREESDRERERWAMAERELRERLDEEERRRGLLERQLTEVEEAASAAERSLEELRLAQRRMRSALQGPAGPDPQA